MEYAVGNNLVRSQNTAKPHTQQSKAVVEYLRSQEHVKDILDFGCGKLRYSDLIVNLCDRATFVDSMIQLKRTQIIRGETTTVAKYVATHYPQCHVVAFEDLSQHSRRYDFIICTNVLSAIPCKETIYSIFIHLQRLLRKKGTVLFVNQHRNSYFKKYNSGKKHLYGYLFNGGNSVSYYGILKPDQIKVLLSKSGLFIGKSWCAGESNFVEAKKILCSGLQI